MANAHDLTVVPEAVESPRPDPEQPVCCGTCRHQVTTRRQAIEQSGAHEHTFRNPAGYSFHVLCYAEAAGCSLEGVPTTQASWFPGYAWCFATCSACGGHLGWHFSGAGKDPFFGLIATRLIR